MTTYDIIIVGGGIVGTTTALSLAQHSSLKIAILEQNPIIDIWDENKVDSRVSAISPTSKMLFENLNVWNNIKNKRISPYKKMFVWDQQGPGELEFGAEAIQKKYLGHIVEDSVIRSSLYEQCQNQSNLTMLAPIRLQKIFENENGIVIHTQCEQVFFCNLLIGADGANSWVRQHVGINSAEYDYGHSAIVTNVTTEFSHQDTAYQRFLTTGPLAFLPLDHAHSASIVWSTLPAEAERLMSLDENTFCIELQRAFENKLGKVLTCSERYSFNLKMRHAEHYVKQRIALVGDAAHTIHPLAGQGVNLGLLDSAYLVDVILKAYKANKDYFSHVVLRRYERVRKSENTLMLNFVEAIKKIFANTSSTAKHVRNLGLSITNKISPLKNFFIKTASGLQHEISFLEKNTSEH